MIIAAINPVYDETSGVSYIAQAALGFDTDFKEVKNLGEVYNQDHEQIVIFHPREKTDNHEWVKVEDFAHFDFPEDAVYVFNGDYGNIMNDVANLSEEDKKRTRWVKIPTESEGFKSINGHIAAGIVLWEIYKRKGKATLDGNTW